MIYKDGNVVIKYINQHCTKIWRNWKSFITNSEPNKTQILGGIASRVVYDDIPFGYINNKLKELRKTMFYNKMLNAASVFLGSDKHSIKEHLKKWIKEHGLH